MNDTGELWRFGDRWNIMQSSEKGELNQDITQIVSNDDDPQFLIHSNYLGWISLFSNSVGNCGADIP
jgi:hypothetical protein